MRRRADWREPWRAAFHSLWAHRLRSILTCLGLIIGVASVITVVQLLKSLEGRIMADVNREGSHTFFLEAYAPLSVYKKGLQVRYQSISREQIQELRELVPEVALASPQFYALSSRLMVKVRASTRRAMLHGVDENGLELASLEVEAGRGFTPTDRTTRAPVVILGSRIAQELELGEADLGRTFTIGGQTAELVGILKRQGEIPFMPQGEDEGVWGSDNEIFIPVGSFRELLPSWTYDNLSWRLQVDPRLPVQEAEELIKINLRRVRGLKGNDPDNFQLTTNRKQVQMVEKLSRTLLAASGAMVSISLLVGGIGVMNIMLVSVKERTREIGLRKAVGARRRNILVQFLIEAMVLCVAGGLLGLAAGLGLGTLLSHLVMKHIGSIPFWSIASALLVPAGVGLAFGIYPASRASRLDPIEALRYE